MSTDPSEIEVQVVDDRAPEDQITHDPNAVVEDVESEIEGVSEKVQKRIATLGYQKNQERRRAEEAERVGSEAIAHTRRVMQENDQLRGMVQQGGQVIAHVGREAAEAEIASQEALVQKAFDEGDTTAMLEGQKKITEAQIRLATLPAEQAPQQQQYQQPQQQPQEWQPPQQQRQPSDNIPDQKAVGWLQKNSWFRTDPEMTATALGIHNSLAESGYELGTDDYYKELDSRIRQRYPEHDWGDAAPAMTEVTTGEVASAPPMVPVQTRKSSPVAPANRGGGRPRKVQLTQSEVTLARNLDLTPEQYAEQKIRLEQS